MRDAEIVEAELMEISAIADDSIKFERIVAWCATYPEEVPFATILTQVEVDPADPAFQTPSKPIGPQYSR